MFQERFWAKNRIGGASVTSEEFISVISNLRSLHIRGKWTAVGLCALQLLTICSSFYVTVHSYIIQYDLIPNYKAVLAIPTQIEIPTGSIFLYSTTNNRFPANI